MLITAGTLAHIAGAAENDNMRSIIAGLRHSGERLGMARPHRLAMYLGQLAHESAGFRYDREIWGPTNAQKRYEGRADLGNTQPGDGSRYRGRGPIQITGRSNYAQFTAWARKMDPRAPDFVANPDAVNTDPWEGLGPLWYWETRGLNAICDRGDYELLTRRINGGLNGYADRQSRYARAALVLMGRSPDGVRGYQSTVGLVADGVVGPKTIASLHKALLSMPPVAFTAVQVKDAVPPASAANAPGIGTAAIIVAAIAAVAAYLAGVF